MSLFILANTQLTRARKTPGNSRTHVHHDTATSHQQRLLVISLGGFRHDFISTYHLPNLSHLLAKSARAPYLNPQFTTQSFPNHWSMATGSFVETHGVIADKFYDPNLRQYFVADSPASIQTKWWNQSGLSPIWSTSVEQGVKTAVMNWPGCDAYHKNDPDVYTFWPHSEVATSSLNMKLNDAIRLLSEDDYRLVMIYYNQPDSIAHKYGINSAEFNVTLAQLDESIGYLMDKIGHNDELNPDNFNLLVVSDHGLSNVRRNVVISEYLNPDDAQIWSFNSNLIHLKPLINMDQLVKKLSRIPDITINFKHSMPERLHYKNNERIGDIIVSGVEGVGFIYIPQEPLQFEGKKMQKTLNYEQKKKLFLAIAEKASHGYDRIYPNMKGVFIAHGPLFKRNFTADYPLENVDVYSVICSVLGLKCDIEKRNCSLDSIRSYFRMDHRLITQYKRQFADYNQAVKVYNSLLISFIVAVLPRFIFCFI